MTVPDSIAPNGARFHVTTSEGDDFVNKVVSVTVTDPDGVGVLWKLPSRLMERLDVCVIVGEEIQLELEEKVQNFKRLGLL